MSANANTDPLAPDYSDPEHGELSPRQRRRMITAAAAGNFVEWYDAGVYGIAATVIAEQIFPENTNPTFALMNTYALFAISYLLRPAGGLIFGNIADRVGRKRALTLTIVMTSVATGLIGLIPGFGTIGWFAPAILLILRLIQSMGTGGEYSTAISFVYEHGPKGRKARSVGVMTSMTFLGFLVGAGLSTLLTLLPGDAYNSYGWRILFFLALPFGMIGLYVRKRTEEGAEFKRLQIERNRNNTHVTPIRDTFRSYWRRVLIFTAFLGIWAVFSTMLTNYLPTFLKKNPDMSPTEANAANLTASAAIVVVIFLYAPVADRIGMRAAIVIATLAAIVLTIPGFSIASHGVAGGFAGAILLGALKGLLAVPMLLSLSQLFPAKVRVTAGGLSYNLAQSIIGGTSPFVAVWLNSISGKPTTFALYVMFFAAVTLVIALVLGKKWIAETAEISGDVGGLKTLKENA